MVAHLRRRRNADVLITHNPLTQVLLTCGDGELSVPNGTITVMLSVAVALFVGLVLGAVLGWLANASRSAAAVSAARTEADALRSSQ